jgi:hypothetical protein
MPMGARFVGKVTDGNVLTNLVFLHKGGRQHLLKIRQNVTSAPQPALVTAVIVDIAQWGCEISPPMPRPCSTPYASGY